MLSMQVTTDASLVARAFDDMARKQVAFAASLAINRIAEFAKTALQSNIKVVFDRPKPFVVNSLFIKRSNKYNLTATVFHSDKVAPYLEAEIIGGQRGEKPFELKIGNLVLVPTANVRRDTYGGVSKAYIAKVLSQARPLNDRSAEYVIVKSSDGGKLRPGIYQRVSGKIRALFIMKSNASYQPRYDMRAVVQRTVEAEWGRQFAAQMDYALSTARIKL